MYIILLTVNGYMISLEMGSYTAQSKICMVFNLLVSILWKFKTMMKSINIIQT